MIPKPAAGFADAVAVARRADVRVTVLGGLAVLWEFYVESGVLHRPRRA